MPKDKDIIVFDLETKKSFDEVGGRDNLKDLGVSVLGAYSYDLDKYLVFEEKELKEFEKMLAETALLVGFNINGFDVAVLQPYLSFDLKAMPTLDMMDDVVRGAGFRISLDNLAGATLGESKSADGLQALRWFREGKIKQVKDYCIKDVEVTRSLYEFGKKEGHVKFLSREQNGIVAIPVNWSGEINPTVLQILQEALRKRKSAEIEYVTRQSAPGDKNVNKRLVDISKIDEDSVSGFCHLRRSERVFKIDRIIKARVSENPYSLAQDKQGTLM